ncbi:MAG: serpin family protein [Candidatus Marinimicrobia bacterium]|nr:serpin family protein [Candidatus Neomarinimicrobiota bacterium]
MKKSPITAFVIALLVIVACAQKETVRENAGGSFPAQAPEEEFVKDDAVQGLNAFTFELYRLIAEATEGNTFYSPLSISAALAITYAGAGTETAREMRKVMHFGPQNEAFHTKYGGMLDGLRSGDDADFEMKIANAAWVQKQYALRNAYLHTIGNAYRSTARELDFREKPQASSDTINQWVSDQTAGRIRDLVPASAITARTRLILTNAVYFNAKWSNPFNEDMTKKAPFYLSRRFGDRNGADVSAALLRLFGNGGSSGAGPRIQGR